MLRIFQVILRLDAISIRDRRLSSCLLVGSEGLRVLSESLYMPGVEAIYHTFGEVDTRTANHFVLNS
jgi:hypothetical protein